jgi:hypothetical protein
VPVLIQNDFTPEALATLASQLLANPREWERLRTRLAGTRALLAGVSRPADNAARAILRFTQR